MSPTGEKEEMLEVTLNAEHSYGKEFRVSKHS